mmetsp:Transcript_33079/g.106130  ORF Transcript_33079/g.106130 Transcript_33079/m.106130 type:complete len:247 (-) Transcript_33079:246-986(-)
MSRAPNAPPPTSPPPAPPAASPGVGHEVKTAASAADGQSGVGRAARAAARRARAASEIRLPLMSRWTSGAPPFTAASATAFAPRSPIALLASETRSIDEGLARRAATEAAPASPMELPARLSSRKPGASASEMASMATASAPSFDRSFAGTSERDAHAPSETLAREARPLHAGGGAGGEGGGDGSAGGSGGGGGGAGGGGDGGLGGGAGGSGTMLVAAASTRCSSMPDTPSSRRVAAVPSTPSAVE